MLCAVPAYCDASSAGSKPLELTSLDEKLLVVAVDVEALPRRASDRHVERLLWGRHENGTAGIGELAALAAEFGVAFTFFLDMCEQPLYGAAIDDAAQFLCAAGQDVELHLHPELLEASWWEAQGWVKPATLQDRYDPMTAARLIGCWADKLSTLTGQKVCAYRAGSFRWSASTIRGLASVGIPLSFNHSCAASQRGKRFVFPGIAADVYRWDNGIVEVPCTELSLFGRSIPLQFPPTSAFWAERLARFRTYLGKRRVTVLDLHSWSLLYLDPTTGHFVFRDDARRDALRRLLDLLCQQHRIVTSRELHALLPSMHLTTRSLAEVEVR